MAQPQEISEITVMSMKYILLLITFCSLSFIAKSQGYNDLGQTKTYLTKLNGDCYISYNTEGMLIVDCKNLYSLFLFDDKTHLCVLKSFELPLNMKLVFLEDLLKKNFKYVKDASYPAFKLVNNTFEIRNVSSKIYINDTYVVTILESSLMGLDSNLFGVSYERCEDSPGKCNINKNE